MSNINNVVEITEYVENDKKDLIKKYEKLNKQLDETLEKIKKRKIEGKNGSPKR